MSATLGMSIECKLAYWSVPLPSGCVQWLGYINAQGYGDLLVDGKLQEAHRVMWETYRSELGPKDIVDHICGNRACVNLDHLRVVTKAQNTQYRVNKNNSTGYRGVCLDKRSGTFSAEVTADGVRYRKYGFATAEEADAYAKMIRAEHHTLGDFTPEAVQ